jgi:hypothetical protein
MGTEPYQPYVAPVDYGASGRGAGQNSTAGSNGTFGQANGNPYQYQPVISQQQSVNYSTQAIGNAFKFLGSGIMNLMGAGQNTTPGTVGYSAPPPIQSYVPSGLSAYSSNISSSSNGFGASAQNSYLSQFPGHGAITAVTKNSTAGSHGATFGGVSGTTATAAPTGQYMGTDSANDVAWRAKWDAEARAGKQPVTNPQFPGFWGGGSNGQFYPTLRAARQATKRKNPPEYSAPIYAPTDPAYNPAYNPAYGVGSNIQTATWRVG